MVITDNGIIYLIILLIIICVLSQVFKDVDYATGGGVIGLLAAIVVVVLLYRCLVGDTVVIL